ncbi:uncharacterized protein OCT59_007266 [Rhizophagus irregularis]|uniref:uncharacterized protein n=1 Tax=Rhizophagus irregularis TaxID=588596 RepID=UPI00332CC25E|nr:hypothetical protein OCT59_007266 [Rhizophagus irregularis]
MKRRTKGLWELPDEFLRTGLEETLDEITNRTLFVERNAGTNSRTGLWVEGNKGKEKTKEKVENENERETFRRFSGSLDKPEFNILKVQRSLYIWNSTFRKVQRSSNVWNLTFRRFNGSTVLERMEFNILKVQRSLNVWNLTFRRFTPASTLALDI